MSKPENPSAFPRQLDGDEIDIAPTQYGMTLRDWFASQVDLSAYCPAEAYVCANGKAPTIAELAVYIAKIRLIEADAMLAERERSTQSADPA